MPKQVSVSHSLALHLNSMGILAKWHDKTFDSFTNDPQALEKVVAYLDRLGEARKDGVGLFLWGKNGTGKTHLIMVLLREILMNSGYTARAITLGTLISLYTSGWYNQEAKVDFETLYKSPDFLEIEEIGKEYKQGENDLGRTVLDTIVRYRLQSKKPILFTTNLTTTKNGLTYTPDIASMLNECCLDVEVTGEDMRKEIQSQIKNKYGF